MLGLGPARNNYCDSGDCVARASRVTDVSRPLHSSAQHTAMMSVMAIFTN